MFKLKACGKIFVFLKNHSLYFYETYEIKNYFWYVTNRILQDIVNEDEHYILCNDKAKTYFITVCTQC